MHKLNAAVKKDGAKLAAQPKRPPGEKPAPASTKKKVVTEQEVRALPSGVARLTRA